MIKFQETINEATVLYQFRSNHRWDVSYNIPGKPKVDGLWGAHWGSGFHYYNLSESRNMVRKILGHIFGE